MQFACIHAHTFFCDGKDDVESFCQAAYKKGFKSLGFSAHAPVTKKTGLTTVWHLRDDRLQEYLDCVNAAKKRWEEKLTVYLGLEVDFIDGLMGPADRDYREMGLDYIIASVHYVVPAKGEPFTIDDTEEIVNHGIEEGYGGDLMGMAEAYLKAEADMIRGGGFDVLGHADLIKVNSAFSKKLHSGEADFYRKKIAELAGLMAATPPDENGWDAGGRVVEVNTGGINRGRIKECYPSLEFLRLFREHGVSAVINSDAHMAEHLDGHYEKAKETLIAAGYTETVLFNGRIKGKAVWETQQL